MKKLPPFFVLLSPYQILRPTAKKKHGAPEDAPCLKEPYARIGVFLTVRITLCSDRS
jgi:hypothetical protein